MDYETSWWWRTGILTEFDKDGVAYPLYRNFATDEQKISRDLPVGALWSIPRGDGEGPNDWPPVGADGLSIACKLTDRVIWYIDGTASNCTRPNDPAHRCWVRHGTVREKLTVDKNGLTCAAGAGSFFMDKGKWHGFLRDGVLKQG